MRYKMIILFFVLLFNQLAAQDETLFTGDIESGRYVSLLSQIGQINNETGIFVGGQGGWIINHRFVIGGRAYGLVNEVDISDFQNLILDFGCGGLFLEYIISSNKLLHLSVQSMIGAGGVRFAVKDYKTNHDHFEYSNDRFFVVEPGINLILNIHKKFRLGGGITYRHISGVEYENLSDSNLSGLSAQLFLKFGKF